MDNVSVDSKYLSLTDDITKLSQYNTMYHSIKTELDEYADNLKLVNLVITIYYNQNILFEKFIKYLDQLKLDYKYEPHKFSGLCYKYDNKNVGIIQKTITCLCFKSGRIVLVGLKNVNLQALLEILQHINDLLINSGAVTNNVQYKRKISNLVFSFMIKDTCFKPLLQIKTDAKYRKFIEYNSEIFPGLKFKIPGSTAIFSIFSSKKVIFTGGKGYNLDTFAEGIKILKMLLQ